MNRPTSRVGSGGCPGPTRHTEPKRFARKSQLISAASRTSGWRRLMIASRDERNKSSWRSSRGWLIVPPNSESRRHKESRTAQIGNPKTQENRHQHRAFLQDRILVQIKSHRSINDFQILHGRRLRGLFTVWLIIASPKFVGRIAWASRQLSARSPRRQGWQEFIGSSAVRLA